MRRLSLYSRKSNGWECYQRSQIEKRGFSELTPAFPGSLIFNHLLVDCNSPRTTPGQDITVPDVSHVVYDYCTKVVEASEFDNSLVIDVDINARELEFADTLRQICTSIAVESITILGNKAFQQYESVVRHVCGSRCHVAVYEPDWMSVKELHAIYRQAKSVLFIDSMRVLDAVGTGCQCSLIVGKKLQSASVFAPLMRYLQTSGCDVYSDDCLCERRSIPVGNIDSFCIVENSLAEVRAVLDEEAEKSHSAAESLIKSICRSSDPVVRAYSPWPDRILSSLNTKYITARRKIDKLLENPVGFCKDSDYRLLQLLGRESQKVFAVK